MSRRPPPLRSRLPGTLWRSFRSLMIIVVVLGAIYGLYAAGVALTTSDKCGGFESSGAVKHWEWVPPKWECGN